MKMREISVFLAVLLCAIIRVDSKDSSAREVRVKNDPYVFFLIFRNERRFPTNDEYRTWTYCRDRCASLKDTSELEWSACLYGCTASKQQGMSRSVRGLFFSSFVLFTFFYESSTHTHTERLRGMVRRCKGIT